MASTGAAYTSGAERKTGELRQRGAPELELNGQSISTRLDAEDRKKLKVSYQLQAHQDALLTMEKLKKTQNGFLAFLDEWEFLIAPLIFTALAFFTRMWKIGLSDIVTWDEAQ